MLLEASTSSGRAKNNKKSKVTGLLGGLPFYLRLPLLSQYVITALLDVVTDLPGRITVSASVTTVSVFECVITDYLV